MVQTTQGEKGLAKLSWQSGKPSWQSTQVLYDFLHEEGQKKISLVTIEGERRDIAPLSVEEIRSLLIAAQAGESA